MRSNSRGGSNKSPAPGMYPAGVRTSWGHFRQLSSVCCCFSFKYTARSYLEQHSHVWRCVMSQPSHAQVPAHLQVQQSSHSAPSMGLPGYFNPYMAMQGPGMMQMGMPHPNMGPPNPLEAAAAHGFSSPPQFRPPPIDAARAHSLGSQQGSPLSPTGKLLCVTLARS